MKTTFTFILSVSLLFIACKKEEPTIISSPGPGPEPSVVLNNTLVSGSDCSSFYRLMVGEKMEDVHAVKQTADGGYIFCGSSETIAESESDILVFKTTCLGETEWITTISNDYDDLGYDIVPLSTGEYVLLANYIVSPPSFPFKEYNGQIIKIGSTGEVLWKKTLVFGNYTSFEKLIEASDGGFVVCGFDNSQGAFVFKTDASGNEIWRNEFNGGFKFFDFALTNNSNYVVCGSKNSGLLQEDLFITEINTSGNTIWTKTIDKDSLENGAYSIATLGSDLVISGYNRTSGTDLPGFVMKLDATGNEMWYSNLETNGYGEIANVVVTQDGKILGVGPKSGLLTMVKMSPFDGTIIWEKERQVSPLIRDMQLCADGGFILSGNLFISAGNRDGFILKTDANGD